MLTLEDRVARLERSCRRWRWGCMAAGTLAVVAALGAAAPVLQNAQFDQVNVRRLVVQSAPGAPQIVLGGDARQAALQLATPSADSSAALVVDKDGANLMLIRQTKNGSASASLGADNQDGNIDLRTVDGKTRDIEPQ